MYNLKKSIDAGDRVEAIDITDNMLLVATSRLGGNVWDSSLRVIDLVSQDVVASVQQRCGCADASWANFGQRAVCAQDSGDVKVEGHTEPSWDPNNINDMPTDGVVIDRTTPLYISALNMDRRGYLAVVTRSPQSPCDSNSSNFVISMFFDTMVYQMMEPDATKQFVEVMNLQQHDDIVSCIAVCQYQDGLILSGSFDRSVHLWDIGGDREAPLNTFTGHSGGVTGVEFAKGDDGGHVFASVSIDSGFRLWDRRQSYFCASHRLGSPALSLSWEATSQALIAVGCQNGTVTILDKRALAVPVPMIQESHVGRVNVVRFSPANIGSEVSPLLASAGDDGTVTLQRVVGKGHEKRSALHSDYVKALAWRDESTLVTGGWDSQLCVMEIGQLAA